MTPITEPSDRPADLPIWGRLNLMRQGIPLDDIDCWERETDSRIIAYLNTGYGYIYLYKR